MILGGRVIITYRRPFMLAECNCQFDLLALGSTVLETNIHLYSFTDLYSYTGVCLDLETPL